MLSAFRAFLLSFVRWFVCTFHSIVILNFFSDDNHFFLLLLAFQQQDQVKFVQRQKTRPFPWNIHIFLVVRHGNRCRLCALQFIVFRRIVYCYNLVELFSRFYSTASGFIKSNLEETGIGRLETHTNINIQMMCSICVTVFRQWMASQAFFLCRLIKYLTASPAQIQPLVFTNIHSSASSEA